MFTHFLRSASRACLGLFATCTAFFLVSCSAAGNGSSPVAAVTGSAMQGKVFGGQQPVTSARVDVYEIYNPGTGGVLTARVDATTFTDANGNFDISFVNCAKNFDPVYIVATGGNPGMQAGTNNSKLVLIAPIGQCYTVLNTYGIQVNEVSTALAAANLTDAMKSYKTWVMNSPVDLATRFTNLYNMIDSNTGKLVMPASGYQPAQQQFYTVADILAACVNSNGGTAACGNLASYTGGTVNTTDAALYMANHASTNVSDLFALLPGSTAFSPTLSAAPASWDFRNVEPAPVVSFEYEGGSGGPFCGNLPCAPSTYKMVVQKGTVNSNVYYTTDGSTPSASSTRFGANGDVLLPMGSNVKVIEISNDSTIAPSMVETLGPS